MKRNFIIIFILTNFFMLNISFSQKSEKVTTDILVLTDKGCKQLKSLKPGTPYEIINTILFRQSDHQRDSLYKIISGKSTILEYACYQDYKDAFDAAFSKRISIKILDINAVKTGKTYLIPDSNIRIYSNYEVFSTVFTSDIYSDFRGVIRFDELNKDKIVISTYLEAIDESFITDSIKTVLDMAFISFNTTKKQCCEKKKYSTLSKIDKSEIEKNKIKCINNKPDTLSAPAFKVFRLREYPGGNEELIRFLNENIKYPEEAEKNNIKGRVIASITLKPDGQPDTVKIIRGLGYGCDEEVIRVIKTMKWKPIRPSGIIENYNINIPVKFGVN